MDWLTKALQSDTDVLASVTAARLLAAFLFGLGVALVHTVFRSGETSRTSGLGTTLILLTILVAAVIYVIGSNTARAFGLVGALSVVRFRTPVSDTRDTSFVIFAVALGMAVGAGYFEGALVAFVVISFACACIRIFGREPTLPGSLKLWVAPTANADGLLRSLVGHGVNRFSLERSDTDKTEAIVLNYKLWLQQRADPAALVNWLRGQPGVLKARWSSR